MPIRPDVGDDIEFLDEISALSVLTDDDLDLVDTEVDELVPAPVPRLAEQCTARHLREGVGSAA